MGDPQLPTEKGGGDVGEKVVDLRKPKLMNPDDMRIERPDQIKEKGLDLYKEVMRAICFAHNAHEICRGLRNLNKDEDKKPMMRTLIDHVLKLNDSDAFRYVAGIQEALLEGKTPEKKLETMIEGFIQYLAGVENGLWNLKHQIELSTNEVA